MVQKMVRSCLFHRKDYASIQDLELEKIKLYILFQLNSFVKGKLKYRFSRGKDKQIWRWTWVLSIVCPLYQLLINSSCSIRDTIL